MQKSEIYVDRGLAYLALEKQPEAISNFERAIELDRKNARAYYNRACTSHQLGDLHSALTDLTEVLYLNPDSVSARANRGLIYHQLGHRQAALQDLRFAARHFDDRGNRAASAQMQHLIDRVRQSGSALG
ncbi:MAG: tetratricopeptide repeat protein [Cyanobacteriota bacterium]|nr:tetratricopeptide repeat protein [Cyanobacteriota bacterium]